MDQSFVRLMNAVYDLLTLYEKELTTYQLVAEQAKRSGAMARFDFDGACQKLVRNPELANEVKVLNAPLERFRRSISAQELPQALEAAAEALERRVAKRQR